ncbi:MAG: hypothetical protein ACRED0_00305 [Gammaproteobacteria bacterium]
MKMTGPGSRAAVERYDVIETIRRAFDEFPTLPTLMIVGFLLLAAGSTSWAMTCASSASLRSSFSISPVKTTLGLKHYILFPPDCGNDVPSDFSGIRCDDPDVR